MELWELVAREQVRHTISSYTFGGDRVGSTGSPRPRAHLCRGGRRVDGRDAIIERGSSKVVGDATRRMVRSSPHALTTSPETHFRSVTPTAIDVSSYFLVITDIGADHWGRYRDRFVPFEDRWLIAHRQVTTDGYGEGSAVQRLT